LAKKNKKQHFVPASYLKAWLDKNCPTNQTPYVWIFNKDGSNGRKRAPENILAETDLYTVINKDGDRNLSIEHGLGTLEDKFSRIRNSKFKFHRELDDDEKIHLCAFVAAAQIRTTKSREHHKEQWGNVLKVADNLNEKLKGMSENQKTDFSKISVSSSTDPKFTYEQIKELSEKPLQKMMSPVIKSVTPILLKMDMAILCSNNDQKFITSDNPCIWYDPEAYKNPPLFRSVGLINKFIEITIPISPDQCLLFNWQKIGGYLAIDSEGVIRMNQRQIAFTDKEFVAHENKTNLEWFKETEMPDDAWENLNKPP